MTEKPVKVVRLEDVSPISYGGGEQTRPLLRGADTDGLYSFYEVSMPSQEGSLYHIHQEMDETFYVIEGEFEIKIGTEIHKAPVGTLVFGPRGVAHSFFNTWHDTSKMLCTTTPGGIEVFFEELQALIADNPPFPSWDELYALGERHNIIAFQPQGGPHGGPPVTDQG